MNNNERRSRGADGVCVSFDLRHDRSRTLCLGIQKGKEMNQR